MLNQNFSDNEEHLRICTQFCSPLGMKGSLLPVVNNDKVIGEWHKYPLPPKL